MNRVRRKIPDCVKSRNPNLYSTNDLINKDFIETLPVYQCKKKLNFVIMSSMHTTDISITSNSKTPETVSFYNKTKCYVNIIDQIARLKAGSRR